MSDRTLGIRITATENASKVFRTVGDSAVKTANELRRAGDEGGKGLDKIEQEAKQAAPAVEKVGESAKRAGVDVLAMGAAVGTAVSALSVLGNSFREQERQVSGIRQLYGEQSDAILQMAEDMQSFTRYSNDAARESALFASSLATNYDMSAESIATLVERSADLAQIFGTDLVDAVTRTSGAIRGEGEAAERLGLNLSDAAVAARALDAGITNWNVPGALTEAEKAAFRFELFLQDTEKTVGAAAAAADNAGGGFRRFANEMQDAGQSIGGFLGPVGQVAAEMAPLALTFPIIGAGAARAAVGIRAITTASMAFVATPLGLTVTAVGGAIALATGAFLSHKQAAADAAAEWERAQQASRDLTYQIQQMTLAGNALEGNWARNFSQTIADEIEWANQELEHLMTTDIRADNWLNNMVISMMESQGLNTASDAAVAQFRQQLVQDLAFTPAEQAQMSQQMSDLFELMLNPNVDANWLREQMLAIFDMRALDEGRGPDWMLEELEALEAQTIALAEAQQLAADGATNVAMSNWDYIDSVNGATNNLQQQTEATEELLEIEKQRAEHQQRVQQSQDDYWTDLRTVTEQEDEAARQRAERRREEAEAIEKITQMEGRLGHERVSAINEAKDGYLDLIAAQEEAMLGLLTSLTGMDDPLSQWNATSLASEYSLLAAEIMGAGDALDSLFRVVVGNTNAIAQQAESVNSWAEELIGVAGEYAAIDDLLKAGRITLDEYNAAQAAQVSIAEDSAAIQEHVQTIQAMQAPIIAAQTAALEEQMAVIAGYGPEQQLIALGWMDAATAAKAMEINTLAAAVAAGQLGTNGEAAFQSYIEGAVAADPVLKALLIDMGLISEVDGNIVINLDGAEQAQSEISMLTEAIVALVDLMDDGELNGSFVIEGVDNATPVINEAYANLMAIDGETGEVYMEGQDNATSVMDGVRAGLNALNGATATVSVYANDWASGVLNGALNAINALDGRTATTYIRTVGMAPTASALGGVPGYASGGIPVELAEWGPERLHFANGGMLDIMQRGIYAVPPNTYVSPNNAVSNSYGGDTHVYVSIGGSVVGENDLLGRFASQIADEVTRKRTALGVN